MPEVVWTGVYIAGALVLCAAFAAAPLYSLRSVFLVKSGKAAKQQILDIPDASPIAVPFAANDDELSTREPSTSRNPG